MFESFGKIPRLNRETIVTEKIDGTNAQVLILSAGEVDGNANFDRSKIVAQVGDMVLIAGSRKRLITPEDDNYGFAAWVRDNAEALTGLGYGRHFGEWWGRSIQSGYGLTHRVFSLFNTHKWNDKNVRPECCSVVPVLWNGDFDQAMINKIVERLRANGSPAAFEQGRVGQECEGVIVYHTAANSYFKITLKNDESPKSNVK